MQEKVTPSGAIKPAVRTEKSRRRRLTLLKKRAAEGPSVSEKDTENGGEVAHRRPLRQRQIRRDRRPTGLCINR